MPIEVQAADGSIIEFPDGMNPADINLAMRKHHIQTTATKRSGEMGKLRKAFYGVERGWDEAAMGLKQITPKFLGGGLSPDEETELSIRREIEKQTPGTMPGRMAFDAVLYGTPAAKAVGAAAQATARAAPLAQAIARYGTAATTGAISGGMKPVVGDESRGENMVEGGIFSAAGQGLGDLGGRIIDGIVKKNPNITRLPQLIRDKLTLGQTADRNSLSGKVAQTTEEILQSVPVAGRMVAKAREGARDTWRDDVIQQVSPRGFTASGGNTREKLDSVYGEFGDRYASALRNTQVTPSRLFESRVLRETSNPQSGLSNEQQEQVRNMVMANYRSRFAGVTTPAGAAGTAAQIPGTRGTAVAATGENAKDFESFLSAQARKWSKAQSPDADAMAQLYQNLERAWSTSYRRQLPLAARREINPLDQLYAPYKTVEKAAAAVGNDYGNFTPQQLLMAVKQRTKEGRFGRGEGVLQDEASVARDALTDRLANSGTTDRAVGLGSLGAAVVDPVTTFGSLTAAVPLMTTRAGRNLMTGDTRLQKLLQQLRLNGALRASGPAAGMAARDVLNGDVPE